MLDLAFQVEGAEPQRYTAEPMLLFRLRVTEAVSPGAVATPIHSVVLRCQVRIEPGRRRYDAAEQERLLALFGTPERWAQTVRDMLWTHVNFVIPSFAGATAADLPVPCRFDFNLAATRYFDAVSGDAIPLRFLFSGTTVHEGQDRFLQVAQI